MTTFLSKMNRQGLALTAMLCFVTGPVFGNDLSIGQTPTVPQGNITIDVEFVAGGITSPVYATHAGDNSGRLFVVDQIGKVWIVDENGLLSVPFLDLTSSIVIA